MKKLEAMKKDKEIKAMYKIYKVKFKGTSIKIDQLVNHSDKLLAPMSFDQSLIDIKKSIY